MVEFLFPLAMVLFLGAVAPTRWGLRFAGAVGLLLAIGTYVQPTPFDPDWGYALVRAGILLTTVAFFTGIGIRALHWLASDPRPVPLFDDARVLMALDQALLFGAGVFLGCIAFQALAVTFAGLAEGLLLHLSVVVAAWLAAAAALRTKARALVLGAAVTVAALALDGAFRYPDLILKAAEWGSANTPRCLMVGPDLAPPRDRSDLMALTIPKDNTGPSDVMLLRQRGGNHDLLRWSFRARAFVRSGDRRDTPGLCTPTLAPLLPG